MAYRVAEPSRKTRYIARQSDNHTLTNAVNFRIIIPSSSACKTFLFFLKNCYLYSHKKSQCPF